MFVQALLLVALTMTAFAQNATSTVASSVAAQTTMNLFLGNNANQEFVGSVIAADACATTYGIACTEGGYSFGPSLSGSCDPAATVSKGR